MKSHTLTRGVALVGALMLWPASSALASSALPAVAGAHAPAPALARAPARASTPAHAPATAPATAPAPAHAHATAPATATATGENTPLDLNASGTVHTAAGGGSSVLRTIVALVLVIALIYGVAWVLRRVKGRGKDENRATGSGLEHMANLPLGANRSLALVRAGREVMLVGIAEHGVTPIRTYTEAELREGGLVPRPEEAVPAPAEEKPLERMVDALRRMTIRS